MNRILQPDIHPDADSLSGFAEHALPETDRVRILAHMAGCARCREVVYLAQAAAETDGPAAATAQPPPAPRRSWLPAWVGSGRPALIPAAALACAATLVLWIQLRPAPPVATIAKNTPGEHRTLAAPQTPVTRDEPYASATIQSAQSKSAQPSSQPKSAPIKSAPIKSAPIKPVPIKPVPLQSTSAESTQPERRSGRSHVSPIPQVVPSEWASSPPSLTSPPGMKAGPPEIPASAMSVPVPAMSSTPSVPALTSLANTQYRQAPLDRPHPSIGRLAATPVEEGTNHEATHQEAANAISFHGALASPPAQPHALFPQSAARERIEMVPRSANGLVALHLPKHYRLPSGLDSVATAALLNRLVAVDAQGVVFRSEDAGKNWLPVPRQWSGKAVDVEAGRSVPFGFLLPPAEDLSVSSQAVPEAKLDLNPGAGLEAGSAAISAPQPPAPNPESSAAPFSPANGGSLPPPPLFFKLTTNRHQVWISADGKSWHKQ